ELARVGQRAADGDPRRHRAPARRRAGRDRADLAEGVLPDRSLVGAARLPLADELRLHRHRLRGLAAAGLDRPASPAGATPRAARPMTTRPPIAKEPPLLRAVDLTRRFGGLTAVNGV